MKILANFVELIGEQTGNTGLGCLIIINVAHLQSCYFFFFFCHSMNFERVRKTHFQYQFYRWQLLLCVSIKNVFGEKCANASGALYVIQDMEPVLIKRNHPFTKNTKRGNNKFRKLW